MTQPKAGFTLFTTIFLMAIAAFSALVVLDYVDLDMASMGFQQRSNRARAAAEGGLMESLNSARIMGDLPDYQSQRLRATFAAPADSAFSKRTTGSEYDVEVELIRRVPMAESSHNRVSALVYSFNVKGNAAEGAKAGMEAEAYRVVNTRPGVFLPKDHAR